MISTNIVAVSVIAVIASSSLATAQCVDYGSGESRLCVFVRTTRENVVGVDFTCSDFDGVENITVVYLGSPLYEHCAGQKMATAMDVLSPSSKFQNVLQEFVEFKKDESVFEQAAKLPSYLQAALGFMQVVTCSSGDNSLVVCVEIGINGDSESFCNTDSDVSRIVVRIGDEDQIDCQS